MYLFCLPFIFLSFRCEWVRGVNVHAEMCDMIIPNQLVDHTNAVDLTQQVLKYAFSELCKNVTTFVLKQPHATHHFNLIIYNINKQVKEMLSFIISDRNYHHNTASL